MVVSALLQLVGSGPDLLLAWTRTVQMPYKLI